MLLALLAASALSVAVAAPKSTDNGVPAAWKKSGLDLMPWPAHIALHDGRLPLTKHFDIEVTGHAGQRVYDAADRLLQHLQRRTGIVFEQHVVAKDSNDSHATLVIHVRRPAVLEIGEDESYRLHVDSRHAVLTATDGLGALHGLQTFLQLVQSDPAGYYLPAIKIRDKPRFRWRGLMIDVARHFEPMNVIERNLRGMAAVKLNVLHLHLSDNQGFRIQSKVYPELTAQGSRGQYFTQAQMKAIIGYADDRGIIVVPEFDLPAHAVSWLVSHPELASAPGPYHLYTHFGGKNPAFDPSNPETYRFLDGFFKEMAGLFPGHYIHIGGDENSGAQWNNNPYIQAYMQPSIPTDEALQTQFIQKLARMINADGKQIIGWDEILQPGLPKGAVIQSWRGKESLYKAAREGHPAILSNGYYLDLLYPADHYYQNDPIPAGTHLKPSVRKNILGGEAEMWGELVRPATIDSRIWPNAAAVAERLWSPRSVHDVPWMYRRLHVENLRLEALGLTQIRNQQVLLRQLAGGYDIGPLQVLVDVVSPVRGYQRGASGHYTIYSSLSSIADAATGNPWAAIQFTEAVNEFNAHPDAATEQNIRAYLEQWIANDPALEEAIHRSPALHSVAPLAHSLVALSKIGLQALGYIDQKQPAPYAWVRQTTTDFLQARGPAAETKLRIVDAIEQLVVMAVKAGASDVPQGQEKVSDSTRPSAQRAGAVFADLLGGQAGTERFLGESCNDRCGLAQASVPGVPRERWSESWGDVAVQVRPAAGPELQQFGKRHMDRNWLSQ
ncbi:MAG TPA: beta-N-acetylhexosaminidase [Rhodanobacteraceae bacterium]|nr:beta-N-acetylhexosaminidase [Rhodanobacteraceae bacterium]